MSWKYNCGLACLWWNAKQTLKDRMPLKLQDDFDEILCIKTWWTSVKNGIFFICFSNRSKVKDVITRYSFRLTGNVFSFLPFWKCAGIKTWEEEPCLAIRRMKVTLIWNKWYCFILDAKVSIILLSNKKLSPFPIMQLLSRFLDFWSREYL